MWPDRPSAAAPNTATFVVNPRASIEIVMNPRVFGRLTWTKSSLVIAVVTGILLVLASSAMAANLGLWNEHPVFGSTYRTGAKPPSTAVVLEVDVSDAADAMIVDGDGRFDDD